MKRLVSLKIGHIITLTIIFYLTYYLLLQDTFLHTSISSIIACSNHLQNKKHFLVLALLPVYIALMIFGSAMLAIYLGESLQQLLMKKIKQREVV